MFSGLLYPVCYLFIMLVTFQFSTNWFPCLMANISHASPPLSKLSKHLKRCAGSESAKASASFRKVASSSELEPWATNQTTGTFFLDVPIRNPKNQTDSLSSRIHGAAIYGNIYHQDTPNVSIYTIHGSYGYRFPK